MTPLRITLAAGAIMALTATGAMAQADALQVQWVLESVAFADGTVLSASSLPAPPALPGASAAASATPAPP